MELRELMIGDCVFMDGTPLAICTMQMIMDPCSLTHAKPIQISEDILKMNGFEIFSEPAEDKGVQLGFDDIQCFRQKDKENGCVDYSIDLDRRSDVDVYHLRIEHSLHSNFSGFCQYVHELQHILRICGLNDIANNFKVK